MWVWSKYNISQKSTNVCAKQKHLENVLKIWMLRSHYQVYFRRSGIGTRSLEEIFTLKYWSIQFHHNYNTIITADFDFMRNPTALCSQPFSIQAWALDSQKVIVFFTAHLSSCPCLSCSAHCVLLSPFTHACAKITEYLGMHEMPPNFFWFYLCLRRSARCGDEVTTGHSH